MTGLNEAFAANTIGKTIRFDVQPYHRGTMTITKITERRVGPVKETHPIYGQTLIYFDTFDIEGDVSEGSSVGALVCGVPVKGSTRDLAGTTMKLVGVSRSKLYDAAWQGKDLIQASCG